MSSLQPNQPEEKLKGPDHRADIVVIAQGGEAGEKVEYSISLLPSVKAAEAMKAPFEKAREPVPIARVGVYAAIGGMMLARGQFRGKRAFPPELCIPVELFLKEASKTGYVVELTRKVLL